MYHEYSNIYLTICLFLLCVRVCVCMSVCTKLLWRQISTSFYLCMGLGIKRGLAGKDP